MLGSKTGLNIAVSGQIHKQKSVFGESGQRFVRISPGLKKTIDSKCLPVTKKFFDLA
jgi:hypothetical protein